MSEVEKMMARIRAAGAQLADRLGQEVVDDALEYLDFNEAGVAVETLCAQLLDHQVSISAEELGILQSLLAIFEEADDYSDLGKLVTAESAMSRAASASSMSQAEEVKARIRAAGAQVADRLGQEIVDDALEYLDFNEAGPAIEILCAQLLDYGVSISAEELGMLQDLLALFQEANDYANLSDLVDAE